MLVIVFETNIPDNSIDEMTITGVTSISIVDDDRTSPANRPAIAISNVAKSTLVATSSRRSRSLIRTRLSGNPIYSAPIKPLATRPDSKIPSSGDVEVAVKRFDARSNTPTSGYRIPFIIIRDAAWVLRYVAA